MFVLAVKFKAAKGKEPEALVQPDRGTIVGADLEAESGLAAAAAEPEGVFDQGGGDSGAPVTGVDGERIEPCDPAASSEEHDGITSRCLTDGRDDHGSGRGRDQPAQ